MIKDCSKPVHVGWFSRQRRHNFRSNFRTSSTDGVIWWESEWSGSDSSDFLIIHLRGGMVNIAVNLGNDTLKSVATNLAVISGRWHRVAVERYVTILLNCFLARKFFAMLIHTLFIVDGGVPSHHTFGGISSTQMVGSSLLEEKEKQAMVPHRKASMKPLLIIRWDKVTTVVSSPKANQLNTNGLVYIGK
ncbi:hypothetical protein COOONC_21239 [Cooperia oncophora]